MKALLDGGYFNGDCMTVTGKTIGENLENIRVPGDQDVIYPVSNPITTTGGVVGLKGNLAPDGAIVKVAGMDNHKFSGPAGCSIARRTPTRASRSAATRKARSSSSATRVRRAAPGCVRCSPPRRRSTARAWATRWR